MRSPGVPLSLANSGGTLRGGAYHMALTRPGIALYGLHPAGHGAADEQTRSGTRGSSRRSPRQARILQRRTARAGDRVGYNGTHRLEQRLCASSYACASDMPTDTRARSAIRAKVEIAGETAPVVGRVSRWTASQSTSPASRRSRLAAVGHATILGTPL